jgi:hypothetical protein
MTAAAPVLDVVHRIPGRLRVRLPSDAHTDGLGDVVGALPGVTSAVWSPVTRGLLVRYDAQRADEQAIIDAIAEQAQVDVAPPAQPESNGVRPTVTGAVISLFGDVDARVTRVSGGALTLGMLVPAVLTLWAARELLRGRAAPLAWSSALWYAHGLFRDYAFPGRED